MSDSGMAPQLMATNGPVWRGLLSWTACAINSLPVPDSPWIRTVAFVPAAFRIAALSRKMALLSPMMLGKRSSRGCSGSDSTSRPRAHAKPMIWLMSSNAFSDFISSSAR